MVDDCRWQGAQRAARARVREKHRAHRPPKRGRERPAAGRSVNWDRKRHRRASGCEGEVVVVVAGGEGAAAGQTQTRRMQARIVIGEGEGRWQGQEE